MGDGARYIQGVIEKEIAAFESLYKACGKDFRNLEDKANELAEEEFRRLGTLDVSQTENAR